MIRDVRAVLGGKMLRTALLSLVQGGPDQVKFGDRTAGVWADKFRDEADREVDRMFFAHLFACAEDEDAGRRQWLEFLRDLARTTFERAVEAAPIAGARRPRAIAVAERILWGAFYRTFPELRSAREESVDAA
jgi:CRISPR system Cascade subunit CasA